MLQDAISSTGQFLRFSRQHPQHCHPCQWVLTNGTQVEVWDAGIIVFTPPQRLASKNKHIVLSSGVHGNETAPIELCDALVQDLLLERVHTQHRVLFLFGNLPAMDAGTRFIEENLNRLFAGEYARGPGVCNAERRRAEVLETSVARFFATAEADDIRLHYDLHTAIRTSKNEKFAVYPFQHGRRHHLGQLAFMAACGVNTILLSGSPTTTFSYSSVRAHQAHAFTVELGQVRPFGQNDMTRFAAADSAIRALITEADYAPRVRLQDMLIYRVNQTVIRRHEDFRLHFADDAPNFMDFAKDTLLASEPGTEYRAQVDGEAIVFPNAQVEIGQRALLTVVPVRLEEADLDV